MSTTLRPQWLPVLGAFASAARHRSFARAGDELHLTAAAVSHHVRKLESSLGVALFHRQARGVTLTVEGRQLADAAQNALGELESAIARLLEAREAPCVRLSALPSLASAWLIPRLPRFAAAFPRIRIHLDSERGLARFDAGGVDLALRYGPGSWPGLTAHFLMGDTLFAAASPSLLARHEVRETRDIMRMPLIADLSPQSWPDWFRAAGQRRVRPAEMHSFSDAADALQAAVAGIGAVLARERLAGALLADGRLLRLPGPNVPARYAYYVVHATQRPPSESAACFIEWLKGEAAAVESASPSDPQAVQRGGGSGSSGCSSSASASSSKLSPRASST